MSSISPGLLQSPDVFADLLSPPAAAAAEQAGPHASLLLVAESILFTITCLAVGLLISSATASQQTAMFISLTGLFLPTVMLSGFMFPIENMPVQLQVISNIVPAKWFYRIVQDVMIKGLGFSAVWKETVILLGMMVLLLALARRNFKIRLQ